MGNWTAADIKADATALRSAGEKAVAEGPNSDSARAFIQEISGMYNRNGAAYVRSVFDQVKQEVGGTNVFSVAANGGPDQLCFDHGIFASAVGLASGKDDPIGMICGYSTPLDARFQFRPAFTVVKE